MTLDHAELLRRLSYDPETGVFLWLSAAPNAKKTCFVGMPAGHLSKVTGYVLLRVNGRLYQAHRLAWFYSHGEWPVDQIDHINGDRADNRAANLRAATDALNRQNTKPLFKNNTSGQKGVGFHKLRGKWRASIRVDGLSRHLGLFESFEEAKSVWMRAKLELHPFNARG